MKQYEVFITAKEGIFDPAGEISKNALANLGYSGVEDVRIGKYITVTCDDSVTADQIAEMCDKLLANPVIEDYKVEEGR